MKTSQNWIGLIVQVFILSLVVAYGVDGNNKICIGEMCEKPVTRKINLDVLGAYCRGICYGRVRDIYNTVCDCDSFVTPPPAPCTTTYLQEAVCGWAHKTCDESEYCEWRKNASLNILSSESIDTCDCPIKQKKMAGPCTWSQDEMTLCSVLKVHKMLYADFQCLCDPHPPTPPPGRTHVCHYTSHRGAQLFKRRRKRLFSGTDAYNCNYPGVVGLIIHLGEGRKSICTATLLSLDTILFDHQCKMAMRDPVYALANSYDIRVVTKTDPVVDMDTIQPVDSHSAGNTLFTAKLRNKLVANSQCVEPACLPNVRIPAHHINLEDCRVLGYGDTSDTFITGPQAKKLQEIKVKVTPTSVASNTLEVVRDDGVPNTACLNEFSAPLVCAHKYTKEWITIGIHQYTGVVCSGKSIPHMFQVANLLSEAMGNRYYDQLKKYQPKPGTELPSK